MTLPPVDKPHLFTTVREYRYNLLISIIALAAGILVLVVAHELLPYHSSNHDEGVYLQQAAMLIDGRLWLTPVSEAVAEAVHPWFFIETPRGLAPKYTPVPAAMFAIGIIAGDPRLALFGIAVCNVALVAAITTEAFDRPTGVLAAVIVAAAPLFLFTSAAFLPYAPTTALNLVFALAYIRSVRRSSPRSAAIAGLAIGLAFFARPYTAVLFAAPFITHALWRLVKHDTPPRQHLVTTGIIAGIGASLVACALAYNYIITGSPLLFPYEAFAPRDGLGFGHRRILGHEVEYTPTLALRANALVLWALITRWFTAGLIGSLLAIIGITAILIRLWRVGGVGEEPLSDQTLQLVLLGLTGCVIAGNIYFWGNLNILGALTDPTDGMISLFGPIYHFDLLLPLAAFAAHGTRRTIHHLTTAVTRPGRSTIPRVAIALVIAIAIPLIGGAEAWALSSPIQQHGAYTAKYEGAYAPFEETTLQNALVFIPPTYGEYQNHPFQWLRNNPNLAGQIVYTTTRNPRGDFAVIASYPNRNIYRYRYHGTWTPDPDHRVQPILEPLKRIETDALTAQTTVEIPDRIARVTVSLTNGSTSHRFTHEDPSATVLTVTWRITPTTVTIIESSIDPAGAPGTPSILIDDATDVGLAITLTEPDGGTLTYREDTLVRPRDTTVQVIWPPASSICLITTTCGYENPYLPNHPSTRPDGIHMNTTRLPAEAHTSPHQ